MVDTLLKYLLLDGVEINVNDLLVTEGLAIKLLITKQTKPRKV
jgi:hypothetical protein